MGLSGQSGVACSRSGAAVLSLGAIRRLALQRWVPLRHVDALLLCPDDLFGLLTGLKSDDKHRLPSG